MDSNKLKGFFFPGNGVGGEPDYRFAEFFFQVTAMAPRTRTAVHNLFTKMKKLINLSVMCLVVIAAIAQEKANIEVSYKCESPN